MHCNSINVLSSKGGSKFGKLKNYALIAILFLRLLLNAQSVGISNIQPIQLQNFSENTDSDLLGFNGKCTDHQITLEWQTNTEYNIDYFEVAKSRDRINWNQLKIAKSAGNSTQLVTYNVTDEQADDGNNYYRLTQVDIDGSRTVYDAINVRCGQDKKGYFSVYPNSSTGSFQVLLNDKNLVGPGILSVKDMKGSELLNRTIEVKPGINMYSITDLKLLAGTYYIQILSGERATDPLKQVIR